MDWTGPDFTDWTGFDFQTESFLLPDDSHLRIYCIVSGGYAWNDFDQYGAF